MDISTPSPVVAASGLQATAYVIEYARGRFLALPPHVTVAIVEQPRVVAVPGAPYYACGLMDWQGQGQWLPLIHMESLIAAYPCHKPEQPRYALVVAWQPAPGEPVQHGALVLDELPQTVTVTNEFACALPSDSDLWPELSLSCFSYAEQAVPILDAGVVFGRSHD